MNNSGDRSSKLNLGHYPSLHRSVYYLAQAGLKTSTGFTVGSVFILPPHLLRKLFDFGQVALHLAPSITQRMNPPKTKP